MERASVLELSAVSPELQVRCPQDFQDSQDFQSLSEFLFSGPFFQGPFGPISFEKTASISLNKAEMSSSLISMSFFSSVPIGSLM